MMSPDQEKAFEALKGDKNLFLTGQPGTGKTWLLQQYIDWCIDNGDVPVRTATTGIAALHIDGRTVHSWSGLRDDDPLTEEDIDEITSNSWTRTRYVTTNTLIIDEVSMLSAQMLENIDLLAKEFRGDSRPFGGIRMIVVGDFFQLPPIGKGARFAFESPVWNFECHYLTTQHRQEEKQFNDILTGIRAGILTEEQKQIIRSRYVTDIAGHEGVIRLDTHNARVDEINLLKLKRIDAPAKTYMMTSWGNEEAVAALKKACLSDERLTLKVGAQVMCTKNDKDLRFVNGSMGIVTEMSDDDVTVRLFKDDAEVIIEKATWEKSTGYGRNRNVVASISQIPLRLAWAITIHKSQGMTLDAAVIDVSRVFETGHAYVAISRVRSLDKVFLQGKFTKGFLSVNDKVREFDNKILPKS